MHDPSILIPIRWFLLAICVAFALGFWMALTFNHKVSGYLNSCAPVRVAVAWWQLNGPDRAVTVQAQQYLRSLGLDVVLVTPETTIWKGVGLATSATLSSLAALKGSSAARMLLV